MCKLCQRTPCPPHCPNRKKVHEAFLKRPNRDLCVFCGDSVKKDKGHYERNGFPYCEHCISQLEKDFLLRNCDTNPQKWTKKMGFSYVYNR